jgi:hypothetical protein
VLPVAVALGFLVLQVALAPQARMYPDTARYAELALTYQGVPAAQAHRTVLGLLCADQAEQAQRDSLPGYPVDPVAVEKQCRKRQAVHFVPTDDPRYAAIFATRVGYPALTAALEPLTGLKAALWAVPVLATTVAGLLIWSLIRRLGLGPRLAAAGQVLLYVLPIGWWGTQLLTEGPVLLAVVVVVVGVVQAMDGDRRGLAVMASGFAALGVVKASDGALLAVALTGAAAAGWLLDRGRRRRWTGTGAVCAIGAALLVGVPAALGWPGLEVSLQDLLTAHFQQPDVADVWAGWFTALRAYLSRWPNLTDTNVALLAGVVTGAWALWRRHRPAALAVGAVAAAAAAEAMIHPSLGDSSRFYSRAWLLVVVGLPVAARLLSRDLPASAVRKDGGSGRAQTVSDARGR